jgi:hypothetical protein
MPLDLPAEGLFKKSTGRQDTVGLFVLGVRAWPRAIDVAAEPLMADLAAPCFGNAYWGRWDGLNSSVRTLSCCQTRQAS